MFRPSRVKKYTVHSNLVAFPAGLWMLSLTADLVRRMTSDPNWDAVALYTMAGGIACALVGAIPGLIDLVAVDTPRARRIGMMHMLLNVAAVGVFTFNFLQRWDGHTGDMPLLLSIGGVLLIAISGWLGGDMLYVHGTALVPRHRMRAR